MSYVVFGGGNALASLDSVIAWQLDHFCVSLSLMPSTFNASDTLPNVSVWFVKFSSEPRNRLW